MGTTESIFSEEPVVNQPSPAEKPPPHYPKPVDVASSQKKIAQQQQQQQEPTPQLPPPPSPARATTVEAAVRRRSFSGAAAAAATTTTTQRYPPPHSIFRLQGLVLGMEHSGKRTLLQRFEGKDPFSSSSTAAYSATTSEILVPYKAPKPAPSSPDAPRQQQPNHQTVATATTATPAAVLDDRIQLHVRAMTDPPVETANTSQDKKGISGISSSSSNSHSGGVDFAILLVDPRQNQHQHTSSSHSHHHHHHHHQHGKEKHPKRQRKRVKQYLESTIRSLLHLQGYTRQRDEQQQEEEGASSTSSSLVIRRPLCLCLLLNFRDLMGDDDDDNDEHILQESDVTSLTMQVLQAYAHQLDSQQMVLQCITVSLQNCYGLALLHYFIYQSYLQRKRHDAQVLLQTVQSLQREAQLYAQSSLLVSYPDFVLAQTTTQQQPVNKQQRQQQQRRPARSHSKTNPDGDSAISTSRITTNREEEKKTVDSVVGEDDNRHVDGQQQPNGRRRVMTTAASPTPMPSSQAKQQPTQPKDSLEAFLGSSSDEEDGKQQGKRRVSPNRRAISADTSDDDDDDFFLDKEPEDEEGEKHAEITPTRDGKQAAELPAQQQTAAAPHERIKMNDSDNSRIMASRTADRPVQKEQGGAEKEQPKQQSTAVDKGSSRPAPVPFRSQEENNNSQRVTNPSTAESAASHGTSSISGDTSRGIDEGKDDALKHKDDNDNKNSHPAATTPASPQQRQEPTESIAAPPPSSTRTFISKVSPASQSVAPKEEMTRHEDHQKRSVRNINETIACLSEDDDDEDSDNNLHTSKSTPAGICDGIALNKNGKGNLESSERETSQDDSLDPRVGGTLVAGSSVTAATQTVASMAADEEGSRNKPVPVHVGTNQHDDSDEDDDGQFFIGDSTKRNEGDDDDDDDDEFFIGGGSKYSSAAPTPPTLATRQKSSTTPSAGGKGISTTTGSWGLSAEAREAIAKAQQAFERELYSPVDSESPDPSSNQPGPASGPAATAAAPFGRATGSITNEQDSVAATAASTSTGERSKKHKKEKKKKKEDTNDKKRAEKKERKKSKKHSGDV